MMMISTLPLKMLSQIALQNGARPRTAGDFLALLETRSLGSVVLRDARNKIHGNQLITLTPVLAEEQAEEAGVEEAVDGDRPEEEGEVGEVVVEGDTRLKDWENQGEWQRNEISKYLHDTEYTVTRHNITQKDSFISVSAKCELNWSLRA